jgi:hypothetical protein
MYLKPLRDTCVTISTRWIATVKFEDCSSKTFKVYEELTGSFNKK